MLYANCVELCARGAHTGDSGSRLTAKTRLQRLKLKRVNYTFSKPPDCAEFESEKIVGNRTILSVLGPGGWLKKMDSDFKAAI